MMLEKKQILVAGGSGFLGTNLSIRLLQEGHKLSVLDNFSSGHRANLKHIEGFGNFDILEQDVADPIDIEVDEIYNMACVASPVQYQEDPLQTLRTSTEGIGNLLKLARRNGARLLQSSTSEVYGNPIVHPQTEDYFGNVNPVGPRACYDEGKRCAETLCMDFRRTYGVDVKIARIFNTYGPYMQPQDGRVVSNFIVQALLDRPITIYGDGNQTRSFCYVDDLIVGLRALMAAPRHVAGPINLGNPQEFTVCALAQNIISLVGSRSHLVFQPLPKDDPCKRRPDIGRAKHLLGWQPKVALEEGLIRTIRYFEEMLLRDNRAVPALSQAHFSLTAQQTGSGEIIL